MPWFHATDVCRCLELALTSGTYMHTQKLDPDEKRTLHRTPNPIGGLAEFIGNTGQASAVSESGFYKLIMRADSTKAKPFQDWVTREVLPAIRRTGGYLLNEQARETAHAVAPQVDRRTTRSQLPRMCNLYRMTASRAEVAQLFNAVEAGPSNAGPDVYPGYPGVVVADGEVRSMIWGFPLVLKGAKGQPLKPKPVNNTRADKLDSFMWRDSFAKRRCLIPVSSFAEAEGPKGAKTRTWFSLPNDPLFAVAGIWRGSPEWGPVYSMVMTEACIHVADVHDRMPVILLREQWGDWADGPADAAGLLCGPYKDLIVVDRTREMWVRR